METYNRRKTNRSNLKILIVVVALAAFSTVFLLTGAVLTAVYGITVNDPEYRHYSATDGTPNTPYQDMIINACLTAPIEADTKVAYLNSKGIDELGLDPFLQGYLSDICTSQALALVDPAKGGWTIDEIKTDIEGNTVIKMILP